MPTGRIQIPPYDPDQPQPIRSQEWGNVIWDQSVNTFATAAQRDAEWPDPHAGSVCFLEATNRLYVYAGQAWLALAVQADVDPLPLGYLAATQVTDSTPGRTSTSFAAAVNFCATTLPVTAGRWYRIASYGFAVVTAAGNPALTGQIGVNNDPVGNPSITNRLPVSGIGSTCRAEAEWRATTTGTVTFASRWWMGGTSPTQWQFNGVIRLVVTDLGAG